MVVLESLRGHAVRRGRSCSPTNSRCSSLEASRPEQVMERFKQEKREKREFRTTPEQAPDSLDSPVKRLRAVDSISGWDYGLAVGFAAKYSFLARTFSPLRFTRTSS